MMTLLSDSIASARTQRDSLRTLLKDRSQFIDSAEFLDVSLDGLDRQSLRMQASAERALMDVLNDRIMRFESNEANAQPQVLSEPGLMDAHTPQAANTIYAPERALDSIDTQPEEVKPDPADIEKRQKAVAALQPEELKGALEANAVSAEADTIQGQTVTAQSDVSETHALPEVAEQAKLL